MQRGRAGCATRYGGPRGRGDRDRRSPMIGWTRFIVRNRKKVIAAWLVAFVLGGAAASSLGDLLTNRFSVPGSDAERGLDLLKSDFGERGDGSFTLVFQTANTTDLAFAHSARAAASRAAGVVKGGRAGTLQQAGRGVAYVQ